MTSKLIELHIRLAESTKAMRKAQKDYFKVLYGPQKTELLQLSKQAEKRTDVLLAEIEEEQKNPSML